MNKDLILGIAIFALGGFSSYVMFSEPKKTIFPVTTQQKMQTEQITNSVSKNEALKNGENKIISVEFDGSALVSFLEETPKGTKIYNLCVKNDELKRSVKNVKDFTEEKVTGNKKELFEKLFKKAGVDKDIASTFECYKYPFIDSEISTIFKELSHRIEAKK